MKERGSYFVALFFIVLCGLMACSKDDDKVLEVTSIKFEKENIVLSDGEKYTIKVLHFPEELPAPQYTWNSSNPKVAIVNEHGEVEAIAPGECSISANVLNVGSIWCKVTVEAVNATDIVFDTEVTYMEIGETTELPYTIEPSNASNTRVRWSSSDENIATVDVLTGVITAVSDGEVQITAKITEPEVTATHKIIVNPIRVSGIELSDTEKRININDTYTLVATVSPDDAKNKTVIWKSSNERIASVNNGVVSTHQIGECDIIATTEDGNFEARCKIVVIPPVVKELKLNLTQSSLVLGETLQLNCQVIPDNAINKDFKWYSTNESVATVDQNGLVISKTTGTCDIVVETLDGSCRNSCKIAVVESIIPLIQIQRTGFSSSVSSLEGVKFHQSYNIINLSLSTITVKQVELIEPTTGRSLGKVDTAIEIGPNGKQENIDISSRIYSQTKTIWTFIHKGKTYEVLVD